MPNVFTLIKSTHSSRMHEILLVLSNLSNLKLLHVKRVVVSYNHINLMKEMIVKRLVCRVLQEFCRGENAPDALETLKNPFR